MKIFRQKIFLMKAKMRCISLLYLTLLLLDIASGDGEITATGDQMADEELDIINPDMEKALKKLENLFSETKQIDKTNDATAEGDKENIYDDMIIILDKINEAVKNSNNAYKFFKANGLDRIVQQSLKVDYDLLKKRILILLKNLFEVAPTTTSAVIPVTVVDRLLDVYVKDNLALKAHSLDILDVWLPENPKVQARLMKVGGLAPFYEQMAKLDSSGIKTLLDLFNKILKEHLDVFSSVPRTAVDSDNMKFYKRIGLLEHIKTPLVCNGLLNIFKRSWHSGTHESNVIITVFDMLKNIKPYCLNTYRGKDNAKKLFVAFRKYVKDPENLEYFESNGLNVTEVSEAIEDYVKKLQLSSKDEM